MDATIIQAEKKRLRRQLLTEHQSLSAQQRACSDEAMFAHLRSCSAFARARSVFLYLGVGFEPDTCSLLPQLWAAGVQVSVPLCDPGGIMEARRIETAAQLSPGAWGLWIPARSCPAVAPDSLDCILVPGLAFDRTGVRLGRGGGYYDRYLQNLSVPTVALCRQAFLLETLPCLPHDQKVRIVITEDQAIPVC